MEQKTLNLDGTIVYCYADGSVEFFSKAHKHNGLHRTFGSDNGDGYLTVQINNKKYKVHRLICMAFHENPENLPQVDHIDRNKKNNTPENLRWVTSKENQDNRVCVDKSKERYGERWCVDTREYYKQHDKLCLAMIKPDGSCTTSAALSSEIYDLLKPLSQKERYVKYQELKKK